VEKTAYEKQLLKKKLDAIHTASCIIMTDRIAVLEKLAEQVIVAELGVDSSNFSSLMLQPNQPRKLHLVDDSNTDRYNNQKAQSVLQKFEAEIADGKVQVHRGLSTQNGY
jgi:ABC-type microcin C transport system duplicated ATPase subunit YejF